MKNPTGFKIAKHVKNNYRNVWYGTIVDMDGDVMVVQPMYNRNGQPYRKPPQKRRLHKNWLTLIDTIPSFRNML